jgi:hypothetical protein
MELVLAALCGPLIQALPSGDLLGEGGGEYGVDGRVLGSRDFSSLVPCVSSIRRFSQG